MFSGSKSQITFSDLMKEYAKDKLPAAKKRGIAKKKYLLDNKEQIRRALSEGYPVSMVAEAATIDFVKSGHPKFYTVTDNNGNESQYETKIRAIDIEGIFKAEK